MPVENRPEDLAFRCTQSFAPLNNKYGQNPCQIARRLSDVCTYGNDQYFPLQALDLEDGERSYRPPNPRQATSCLCSMGVYNLVQACAACQQESQYTATQWTNWVANCTMSNINGGATFPFAIPSDTALPDWACANNAGGSLSVGQVFRHVGSYNSSRSFPSSSSSSSSSTTYLASSTLDDDDYTEAAASQTLSKVGAGSEGSSSSSGGSKIMTVAIVIPLVVAAALLGAIFAYLRKKRKFRRRGHRLNSTSDLTGEEGVVGSSRSEPSTVNVAGGGLMKHKESRVSLFLPPSESVFTRNSGRSFTTNSVSTGAPHVHHNSPFRSSTAYTPSTGFDTISRSTEYTYDDGASYADYERDQSHTPYRDEDDDESISPFSDLHRPPPSRTATRNNIHTSPAYRHSVSTFASSVHLSESSGASQHDSRSLLTVSSRGAPPSSSGATYGGLHDDDERGDSGEDEDEVSLRSGRR
ncbi:hypothetical protein JCM11641_004703 [Rhodosporidiobolus odoratus]